MVLPTLSETIIRGRTSGESFHRGQQYYKQGSVISLLQRDNLIQAEVEGSQYAPYRVRILFEDGIVTDATCTCAYDYGGWCKHIVATALVCIHEPGRIEERPTLNELLADLSHEQLRQVLVNLVKQNPDLTDVIETQVTLLHMAHANSAKKQQDTTYVRQTPLQSDHFRRQVRSIMQHVYSKSRRYEHHTETTYDITEQLSELVEQAHACIKNNDARNALIILEAIIDEYSNEYRNNVIYDDYGYFADFFQELGSALAKAFLTDTMNAIEHRHWKEKLSAWMQELDDCGLSDLFLIAEMAFVQGWDDPVLRQILRGDISAYERQPPNDQRQWAQDEAWDDDADAEERLDNEQNEFLYGHNSYRCDEESLDEIRFDILERQERYQECLYLAQATNNMHCYTKMLMQLGHGQEAVEVGRKHFDRAVEALALAQELHAQGDIESAISIAEHGLTLNGSKHKLGVWLRDLANSRGQPQHALQPAVAAFQSQPSINDYRIVQDLAGDQWPAIREKLIQNMRQAPRTAPRECAEIFVHEGLFDDAIKAAEHIWHEDSLIGVMDAVVRHHPEWVINTARTRAERIINAGQSNHYDEAVRWLEKVRAAYQAAGRQHDWQTYLDSIRCDHGRKHKLMGLMKEL